MKDKDIHAPQSIVTQKFQNYIKMLQKEPSIWVSMMYLYITIRRIKFVENQLNVNHGTFV